MIRNQNVLIAALDERGMKYRSELKTCKQEFSEEAVHDLRVATRRLLAVMDILRSLDPNLRVQKVRRTLKNQLDALDDLRDTQVMLVDISELVGDFPDLKTFEEYLLKREKKLLRVARKETQHLQISGLRRRTEKIRVSLEGNAGGKRWAARLFSVVDQAYARAIQDLGQIDASRPASIHSLRIAFKKIRYMIEIVGPLLREYPETVLRQMHDYQSKMGDIQDANVLLNALEDFSGRTASPSALEPARRSFGLRRTELINAFMDSKDAIHSFWRKTPDEPFPWEK